MLRRSRRRLCEYALGASPAIRRNMAKRRRRVLITRIERSVGDRRAARVMSGTSSREIGGKTVQNNPVGGKLCDLGIEPLGRAPEQTPYDIRSVRRAGIRSSGNACSARLNRTLPGELAGGQVAQAFSRQRAFPAA